MTLAEEVTKLIDDSAKRNPMVLEIAIGERDPDASVPIREEIELILDLIGGLRKAIIRVAREIDAPSSA